MTLPALALASEMPACCKNERRYAAVTNSAQALLLEYGSNPPIGSFVGQMCSTPVWRKPHMVMFFFLVPYWGVFYFRFSIANGFIVVNLAFISFVWLLQKFGSPLPVPLDCTAALIRPSGRK